MSFSFLTLRPTTIGDMAIPFDQFLMPLCKPCRTPEKRERPEMLLLPDCASTKLLEVKVEDG